MRTDPERRAHALAVAEKLWQEHEPTLLPVFGADMLRSLRTPIVFMLTLAVERGRQMEPG